MNIDYVSVYEYLSQIYGIVSTYLPTESNLFHTIKNIIVLVAIGVATYDFCDDKIKQILARKKGSVED